MKSLKLIFVGIFILLVYTAISCSEENDDPFVFSDEIISKENIQNLGKYKAIGYSKSNISYLEFTGDKQYLIAAAYDGTIKVYDMNQFIETKTFFAQDELLSMLVNNEKEEIITGGNTEEVNFWDYTGNLLSSYTVGYEIHSMALSPDCNKLAIGCESHKIIILDLSTNEKIAELTSDYHYVSNLLFSKDQNYLFASYERDNNVILKWDTNNWGQKELIKQESSRIDYHSIKQYATDKLVIATSKNAIESINSQTGDAIVSYSAHTSGVHDIAISYNEELIASAGDDGKLIVWNAKNAELFRTVSVNKEVMSIAFSPDGKYLAFYVAGKGVQIWAINK